MPESYPFPTYSGLLTPEHYKKIGSAIWLFLWCISSTTKEVERDGVTWGIVLGNKPLTRKELAEPFGVSERTVQRWLDDLERYEYIKITRAPYGYILTVKNSKKYKDRVDKNVQSDGDKTKMSSLEWTEMSNQVDKNVHSNKDITKINNTTTNTDNKDPIDLIADRFADLRTAQEGRRIYPNIKDYKAIAQIVAQGVPSSRTIELLEQCFRDFEERNPGKKIKAFAYCVDYILEHYQTMLAKEEALKLAKRRIPEGGIKNNQPSPKRAAPKAESITGGRVGRIRTKKA
ncbi:HTH domain-containing protein [Peribacillus tepidiphilus]|jgi:DNA-binding transcriptional regulator YhcF (GntR family)|uniref:HTH domain-containing protein n=1 Tax=Peribacillus tepidiphilus TaxID=2652445 RepID=UPI0012916922|nr:HTH domain-containing protein [Peribacillus tepidiphilus]